jgi:hypothetical protein
MKRFLIFLAPIAMLFAVLVMPMANAGPVSLEPQVKNGIHAELAWLNTIDHSTVIAPDQVQAANADVEQARANNLTQRSVIAVTMVGIAITLLWRTLEHQRHGPPLQRSVWRNSITNIELTFGPLPPPTASPNSIYR